MNLDWSNVQHFRPDEFLCRCGCGGGVDEMRPECIRRLDHARQEANMPFVVTSGFRCLKYNAEVGGVSSSAHTRGFAADIRCNGSRTRARIIQAAIEAGFNRIGIAKDFIHLDADPDKAPNVFWVY